MNSYISVGRSQMNKVAENAVNYFDAGFNCAEAVLRAVTEFLDGSGKHEWYRLATPFGGGVGGTKEELCGALTGGILAIGYLAGREDPQGDANFSKHLAVALRTKFIEMAGCTQCQAVLDRLGPQQGHERCAGLVAGTVRSLMDLLDKKGLISDKE
jgi:C_GCAxxG_C_C family probable redox protein